MGSQQTMSVAELEAQFQPKDWLTHSRVTCFRICPRKCFLRYEVGLRPTEDDEALRIGSLFHLAKETYDTLRMQDISEDERVEQLAITIRQAAYSALDAEIVLRLELGHRWYWQNDAGYEILETERAFLAPIVNPKTGRRSRTFADAGKRDRIVRIPDGRVALQEYKTTRSQISPESDYWVKVRLDPQVTRYLLAARAEGITVDTVLYDVTRRPASRPSLLSKTQVDAFLNGSEAVSIRAGEWYGKQFTPALLESETPEMFAARKEHEPKAQKPRKLKPQEQLGFAEGIDEPERKPGEWYDETHSVDEFKNAAELGADNEVRYRETVSMYGARLTSEIAANPQDYYQRIDIARTSEDIREFQEDLWLQAKAYQHCRTEGHWFRNTTACTSFGRCEYLPVCHQQFDRERSLVAPAGFEYSDEVHPELFAPET